MQQRVEILAHFNERLFGGIVEAGVAQVVFQQTAHEILQREIMHAAHALGAVFGAGLSGALHHTITNGQGGGDEPVVLTGGLNVGSQREA